MPNTQQVVQLALTSLLALSTEVARQQGSSARCPAKCDSEPNLQPILDKLEVLEKRAVSCPFFSEEPETHRFHSEDRTWQLVSAASFFISGIGAGWPLRALGARLGRRDNGRPLPRRRGGGRLEERA